MKATVKQNFRANGVKGEIGKVLSDQEVQKVGKLMDQLVEQKIVVLGEQSNPSGQMIQDNPASQSSQLQDVSPFADSDEGDSKHSKKKK